MFLSQLKHLSTWLTFFQTQATHED